MEKTFNYVLALQNKLSDKQKARLDKIATGMAATGAFAAYGLAGAQETPGLNLSAPIGAFGTSMTQTITTNAPALFGILAISVGFFFLWGRVRALF